MACVSNAEHSWTRAFAIACFVGVPVIYVLAQVAHVVIDGGIDADFTRSQRPDFDEAKASEPVSTPDAIAANRAKLYRQPRSAWTHELDLRPWGETW